MRTLFYLIRRFFRIITWSEKPDWISPPMRGVRYRRSKVLKRVWIEKRFTAPADRKIYVGLGEIDVSSLGEYSGGLWSLSVVASLLSSLWWRSLIIWWPWGNDDGIESFTPTKRLWAERLQAALGLPPWRDLESLPPDPLYRLDLSITEAKLGNSFLRWGFFGTFLGFGHAWLQIEGILTDVESGRRVLQFVERRRHSGLNSFRELCDIRRPDQLVGEMIQWCAADILNELDAVLLGSRRAATS